MNWDALGAIGELVGAVAVVATLAYLARQVQASSRTSAVESRVVNQQSYSAFIAQLIQSPELDELYKRGREKFESLTTDEQARFTNIALQTFSNISSAHYQYSTGVLDEDGWYECRAILRFWFAGQGTRDWSGSIGQFFFAPRFREVVEAETRSAKVR